MGIRTGSSIDFDGDALKLVKTAASKAQENTSKMFDQFKRDYMLSNSYVDMTNRDPDMANLFIPKIWSIIRNKYPKDVKAHTGVRPYFPFEPKQKENELYAIGCKAWEEYIDDLLFMADWRWKMTLASLIKTTYGTAFLEAIPYYDPKTFKLRMKVNVKCPWEVLIDNLATGLEEPGQCRYLVHIDVVSKRQIIKLAMNGGYRGLDIDKLIALNNSKPTIFDDEKGNQILSSIGLGNYGWDDDIGIILRYQSEDRYIDVWNDNLVLRESENPFTHGLINTSRYIHDPDSHTRNQFWGIGECKPNEVQQDLLNTLYEMAVDSWQQNLQPLTLYDEVAIDRASVVRSFGNKIPVRRTDEAHSLDNYLRELPGQELPMSHYNMISMTGDNMDMSSGVYEPSYGKPSEGSQTAYEIAKLDENGSARYELNISLGEDILLRSFGTKLMDIVTAAAQPDDLVDALGVEKAMYALSAIPNQINGSYRFNFTGSSRVSARAINQRNMDRVYDRLANLPNTNMGKLATMYAEAYDMSKDDIQELIVPDEVVFQQQMQQMAMEQQMAIPQQAGKPNKNSNSEIQTNQTLQNKNNREYRAEL